MTFVNEYGFATQATYRTIISSDVRGGKGFRVAGTFGDGGLLGAIKPDGTTDWQKTYIIDGRIFHFWSGLLCDDGDMMLHGSLQTTSPDFNESIVVRVSPDGTPRWAKSYTTDRTRLNVRIAKGEGDTYFIGAWYNESGTTDDIEVVKIDGAGTVLAATRLHTAEDDQLMSIVPFNGGCLLVGGTSYRSWSGFVAALDSDLHLLWANVLNAADFQQINAILRISGGFVIAGETGSDRKPFVAFFDPSPQAGVITAFTYDILRAGDQSGRRLLLGASSSGIILGATASNAPAASVVARLTKDLAQAWVKRLAMPGDFYLESIVDADDAEQGLALCGFVSGAAAATLPLLAYTDSRLTSCVTADVVVHTPKQLQLNVTKWADLAFTPVDVRATDYKIMARTVAPALKELCPRAIELDLTDASVQSPYIRLEAAGSDASDDTMRGVQLRWDFLRRLGESHLAKGNLAAPAGPYPTTIGFNRADDFVRIYRSPVNIYIAADVHLQSPPATIYESGPVREWVYEDIVAFPGITTDVSLRFLDAAQYDALKATWDPRYPINLIHAYKGIIEARTIGKLAFKVHVQLSGGAAVTTNVFRIEAIGLPDRLDNRTRRVACRRFWSLASDSTLVCENIESIRFDYSGCFPVTLSITTYDDWLFGCANRKLWEKVGDFSLDDGNADGDANVFRRLEDPHATAIDNHWPKFRRFTAPGLARVNVQNYRDRWSLPGGGLKQGVVTYLSASRTDLKANVDTPNSDPVANLSTMELSYLDLLDFVSIDYHAARMLGLGTIDSAVDELEQFVYLMTYVTEAQLEHETPKRLLHCYMTQPTKLVDYRLPPPPSIGLSYGLPPEHCGGTTTELTDANGYAKFDDVRFVNLSRGPFRYELPMQSFFQTPDEFCLCEEAVPVAYGVKYGLGPVGAATDEQPELSHNDDWRDPSGVEEVAMIPDRSMNPVYTHGERNAGEHHYQLYSINWFSRISPLSNEVQTDITAFAPRNTLLPPSAFAVQLIQPEDPRILTTADEQAKLAAMPAGDKTLVRVMFDWNQIQNQAYFYADKVELYFRTPQAAVVRGKVASVTENAATHTVTITTMSYVNTSVDPVQTVQPEIKTADRQRFTGGRFGARGQGWIVQSISGTELNPTLVVEQIRTTKSISADQNHTFCTVEEWISPQVGDAFLLAENLNQTAVWNPKLAKEVSLAQFSPPYSEIVVNEDGTTRTVYVGGLSDSANVTDVIDDDPTINSYIPPGGPAWVPTGAYVVSFATRNLPATGDPDVEFQGGVLRIRDVNCKLKVLQVWNIDTAHPQLELVVYDAEFGLKRDPATQKFILDSANHFVPVDGYVPIPTGTVPLVNVQPSYRVYLKSDTASNFEESAILPAKYEGSRQTLMTARSKDTRPSAPITSSMCKPAVLVARELHEPVAPAAPIGPLYATRPNFYGKATYTFDVQIDDPHSLIFYKSNERLILDQLYAPPTARGVAEALDTLPEVEKQFAAQRWHDLVHVVTDANGQFPRYVPGGFQFLNPDRPPLNGSAPASMSDAVRQAIEQAFIPLTEVPMVYRKLPDDTMQTSGNAPAVRYEKNASGDVLQMNDAGYGDPSNTRWVRFSDYKLDGASTNIYFYYAVELSDQLKISQRSGIAGPVTLVNSTPPVAPVIRDLRLRSANPVFEQPAAVVVSVNPYPAPERVVQTRLYRAFDASSARSVRTMTLVHSAGAGEDLIDDFHDVDVVPYGDPIFYRVVAMRRFTNEQGQEELAPSWPSDLRTAQMIDEEIPPAPDVAYTYGTPIAGPPVLFPGITLTWQRTAWKPRYHIFKMNSLGNWVKVHTLATNDAMVTVDLATTELGSNVLPKQNAAGETIYHRFKVVTESSGGLLSRDEKAIVI